LTVALNYIIAIASLLPLFHPISRSSSAIKRIKSAGVLLPLFLSCLASNFVFYAFEHSFVVNFAKSLLCLFLFLTLQRWGFCRSCTTAGFAVKMVILCQIVIDGLLAAGGCTEWMKNNYANALEWITISELVIAAVFNLALLAKNDR